MPPLTVPLPVPWPSPVPGVGTPIPDPVPAMPIPFPTPLPMLPSLAGSSFAGIVDPFSNLFNFSLDWRFIGAFVFLAITVGIVDSVWPSFVWAYVAILLMGLMVVNSDFTARFRALLGG